MTAVRPAGVVPATDQDRNGAVLRPPGTDRAAAAADGTTGAADGTTARADDSAADADRRAVNAAVRAMLEARSVALVGASARPATFGRRMLDEVAKSSARPRLYPVNPKYADLDGARCYPSLADLPESPDLALLAVPDAALEQQLARAAEAGCRGAVIFGNAHEDLPPGAGRPVLRDRLAAIARSAAMALCGAGCMGFVNVSHGLRAIGYTEPDPLPTGPIALVTHSGSVFSALLRSRRGIGFTLAVSSGQELVTAAPAYLEYALDLPDTRVLGLVLEAIRDGASLRRALAAAAERDIPVVLLTVGSSAGGRQMVAAHSGALAGSDASWEALARAYGVLRVSDLAEFADTLELFSVGRRARVAAAASAGPRAGLATVHDSGLERAHVVDMAEAVGVPFAEIGPATVERLTDLLDAGLVPANPLDVWGTGADTRDLFGGSLLALAADPAVQAVALAIDLVHELDDDQSYPLAMLDVAGRTDKPLAVLSNLGSAIDPDVAGHLRAAGVPVLEGTRSGLLALRHLLDHASRTSAHSGSPAGAAPIDSARQARGVELLTGDEATGAALLDLLAEYGIEVAPARPVASVGAALAAAEEIGYPVVLKTDEPRVQHKSDVGGVLLGIGDAGELASAYADLAARLGPRALVCRTVPAGVELALGIVRDPELGPLVVVGAGGVLVELLSDRSVALPPVSAQLAKELLADLRVRTLLRGVRGAPPADLAAVIRAIRGLSELAVELGDELDALDINPLICGPGGATAVDALAIARRPG
ncbi:MAG TPA: acetate--CoA ligase family protein [Streptosporangiaceae bacterium]|nr:acetate--CoA ligase family protein [Streptosporangiaceae bacterium]